MWEDETAGVVGCDEDPSRIVLEGLGAVAQESASGVEYPPEWACADDESATEPTLEVTVHADSSEYATASGRYFSGLGADIVPIEEVEHKELTVSEGTVRTQACDREAASP